MGMASTQLVEADQCRYGLMSRDPKYGWGPARKPTKFMTNSVMVARELNLRCEGDHDHVHLMSGRAGPAARYPRGLCEAICRGLAKQKRLDMRGLEPVGEISLDAVKEYDLEGKDTYHEVDGEPMDSGVFKDANGTTITAWREKNVQSLEAYDDVTGVALDP